MDKTKTVNFYRAIANELGHDITSESAILDFGCGEGEMVYQLRNLGFKAFGVDIKLGTQDAFLRLIPNEGKYRIPFDDDTFDFIFSNQVLEHAKNLPAALSEMYRVLRCGGFSLHFFPSKLKPIEAHILVPFAGMFQAYPWLLLWSFLGIRNSFQKELPYKEVARRNYEYLRNNTAYISKNEIQKHILAHFDNVIFAEKHLIKHSYGRARLIYPIVRVLPAVASLYGCFHSRVIFFEKRTPHA